MVNRQSYRPTLPHQTMCECPKCRKHIEQPKVPNQKKIGMLNTVRVPIGIFYKDDHWQVSYVLEGGEDVYTMPLFRWERTGNA